MKRAFLFLLPLTLVGNTPQEIRFEPNIQNIAYNSHPSTINPENHPNQHDGGTAIWVGTMPSSGKISIKCRIPAGWRTKYARLIVEYWSSEPTQLSWAKDNKYASSSFYGSDATPDPGSHIINATGRATRSPGYMVVNPSDYVTSGITDIYVGIGGNTQTSGSIKIYNIWFEEAPNVEDYLPEYSPPPRVSVGDVVENTNPNSSTAGQTGVVKEVNQYESGDFAQVSYPDGQTTQPNINNLAVKETNEILNDIKYYTNRNYTANVLNAAYNANTASTVNQLVDDIDAINAKFTNTNQKLDNTNQKLTSTNTKIDNTNQKLTSTNTKIDNTNQKLNNTNTKLTNTNTKLDNANAKLGHINTNLIEVDGSIDGVLSNTAEIASLQGQAHQAIQSVDENIIDLVLNVYMLNDKTQESVAAMNTVDDSIKSVKDQVSIGNVHLEQSKQTLDQIKDSNYDSQDTLDNIEDELIAFNSTGDLVLAKLGQIDQDNDVPILTSIDGRIALLVQQGQEQQQALDLQPVVDAVVQLTDQIKPPEVEPPPTIETIEDVTIGESYVFTGDDDPGHDADIGSTLLVNNTYPNNQNVKLIRESGTFFYTEVTNIEHPEPEAPGNDLVLPGLPEIDEDEYETLLEAWWSDKVADSANQFDNVLDAFQNRLGFTNDVLSQFNIAGSLPVFSLGTYMGNDTTVDLGANNTASVADLAWDLFKWGLTGLIIWNIGRLTIDRTTTILAS